MQAPLIGTPDVSKLSPEMAILSSILTPNLTFVVTTIVTIYLYFAASNVGKWGQRTINNVTLASWSASLSVVFSLGLLSLRSGPSISYWAALPIIPSALIYGQIAELPGLNVDLKNITSSSQGLAALITTTIFAFIYVMYIIYNLIGKSYYEIFIYLLPVTIFLIWVLLWLSTKDTYKKEASSTLSYDNNTAVWKVVSKNYKDNPYKFRMHHWMLALIGFFISKHQTVISDLGLGVFWGVFVQSLASYGIDIPVD